MEDIHIINGCLKGQEKSFKALVDKYSPVLMGICFRYLKDMERAKDVLQDSLITICQNIHSYKDTGSFKSWLSKITVNVCLKEIRKFRYLEDIDSILSEEYTGPTPIENLHVEDIMSIMHRMPDIHRVVFNLFVIEGYNHAEIASLLDIAESSSRVYLTRARQFLQLYSEDHSLKNKMV